MSMALVVFSGCLLVFRQKNIRTKGSFKGQMYIQASLMFICSLNVCTNGAESATLFVEKEQKGDIVAVFAIASFLAGTRNLIFMVCRMCFGFSLTLYRH